MLSGLCLLFLLTSCHTAQVLIEAPEEFYITLEQIPIALVTDVEEIVRFVLRFIL